MASSCKTDGITQRRRQRPEGQETQQRTNSKSKNNRKGQSRSRRREELQGQQTPSEETENDLHDSYNLLFHKDNPLICTGKGIWILLVIFAGTKMISSFLAGAIIIKFSSWLRQVNL